ncbi:MAG: hypothetical protein Q9M32_02960 [Sulfurimonas sp.]|nr:hypothetical protein [Sulfurimonas sp.]MDQ7059691.1 hypothetical protein [Sulfurimonas sp.]
MSALSKAERDGLDDVFLSIHTNHDKFLKFKDFSFIDMIKLAKYGTKETRLTHFMKLFSKKKKNLSK